MRRWAIIPTLAALLAAVPAAPAAAGTYEVVACDAAPGFVNNSWTGDRNDAGMAVYQECPSGGFDTGLVTRHNGSPAGTTVPSGAASRWFFSAPAGAGIVGIRMNARFEQWDHRWQVGLSNGATLIDGCWPTSANTGGTCGSYPSEIEYIPIPGNGTIYTETYCVYGPCPASYNANTPGHV
jgi:hypothetical protein